MDTQWQDITNRLDVVKGSRDTTYDKSKQFGRAIKKIQAVFHIPEETETFTGSIIWYGRILRQYNCAVEKDFRIISGQFSSTLSQTGLKFLVCIKYRVGNVVTRYRLAPVREGIGVLNYPDWAYYYTLWGGENAVQAAPYTNQRIKKNFCLEFWGYSAISNRANLDINLTLNTQVVPDNPDELEDDQSSYTKLTRDSMSLALPLVLPVTFGEQAGVTN